MDQVAHLQEAYLHRVDALPEGRPPGAGLVGCAGCSRSTASVSGTSPAAPPHPSPTPGSARPSTPSEPSGPGPAPGGAAGRLRRPLEHRAVERGALAAHLGLGAAAAAGRAAPRWPALAVPAAAADVHPVPPVARLVLGVAVVVLAGQLQPEQLAPSRPTSSTGRSLPWRGSSS